FVAWFAGLFYLVRMFVYHVEAQQAASPRREILSAQFSLMERRVYRIICTPALVLTWIFGLSMLWLHGLEWFRANLWMHHKLALLLLLTGYHFWCGRLIPRLQQGAVPFTSFQFRLLNELPTLFLVFIVFLAVLRDSLHPLKLLAGVTGFGVGLFLIARWYKKRREDRS
ncbi:MAG: TIGR00701 family protein, partial [Bacteroidetes bacterium]